MKILSVLYIVILISLSNCIRFSFFSSLFNKKEVSKFSLANKTKNESQNTGMISNENSNKMKKAKKTIESVKLSDDEFMLQLEMKKYDIERSNAFSEMMF